MAALDQIALKHGTDKSSAHHNYCNVYERYFHPFSLRPIRILEFGVDTGASIRTWLDYFPFATVVGCDFVPCKPIENPRYTFIQSHILNVKTWDSIGSFDIIIDDNGHAGNEAIGAVVLGWKVLNSGGLFIIEDLHTCYDVHFTPPGSPNPLDHFRNMIDLMNDHGKNQCGDNRKDKCDIEFIHFWKSLVVIGKR